MMVLRRKKQALALIAAFSVYGPAAVMAAGETDPAAVSGSGGISIETEADEFPEFEALPEEELTEQELPEEEMTEEEDTGEEVTGEQSLESETEAEVIEYKFTKGDGQTWMKRSNKTADFEVTRNIHDELAFGLYLDIEIDGKKVDKSQYKYEEGCVELYISADYMETLALGEHTIKALFEDGEAEAKFLVAKEETPAPPAPTPNTGDTTDIALWGALMTVSNLGIAGITMLLKKKEDEE